MIIKENNLHLHANGAHGGEGQEGPPGEDNKNTPAAPSQDPDGGAFVEVYKDNYTPYFDGPYLNYGSTTYYVARGVGGVNGGNGGPGGPGGAGGQGCLEGKITAYGQAFINTTIKRSNIGGKPGEPGNGGKGGAGAPGGQGGRSMVRSIFKRTGKPDRVTDVRYGESGYDHYFEKYLKGTERGESGSQGASGDRGPSGTKNNALLANPKPINVQKIFSDYFLFVINHEQLTLPEKIAYLENNLRINHEMMNEPKTWLELLNGLVNRQISEGGMTKEKILQWLKIYGILRNFFIEMRTNSIAKNPNSPIWGEPEWQYVSLALLQKLQHFEDMFTGSKDLGIGYIVNLPAFTQYVLDFLGYIEKNQIEEQRQQYFKQFTDRIDKKIVSGKTQVTFLKEKVDALMHKTTLDIREMLKELNQMTDKEADFQKKQREKREALKAALYENMALNFVSMGLSLVGVASGAAGIFSQLGSQALAIKQSNSQIKMNIEELNINQDLNKKMEEANRQFNQKKLDVSSLGAVNDLPEDELSARLFALKNSDKYLQGKADLFKTTREGQLYTEYLQLRADRLKSLNPQTFDSKMNQVKNELLNDIDNNFALKKQELDVLKAQAVEKNEDKKFWLYQKNLDAVQKQKQIINSQKISQGISIAANVGSVLMNGIVSAINTEKNYEDSINQINQAIDASDQRIKMFKEMATNLEDFQKKSIQGSLKEELNKAQEGYANSDTFQLSVQGLEMKQGLEKFRNEMAPLTSVLQSSSTIFQTMKDIQDTLQTQIEIYEKIENQKDNKSMGNLIFGVTSQEIESLTTEMRNLRDTTDLDYLTNLYLATLRSYSAWSFPFGLNNLGTNMLNELMPKENMTREKLIAAIKSSITLIDRQVKLGTFSLTKSDKNFKSDNFCRSSQSGPFFHSLMSNMQKK